MKAEGLVPYGKGDTYRGTLQDIMWNAGSLQYFENAIAHGRPVVAFVENAPPGRGFSTIELPTALKYPNAVINGYPVSTIAAAPDPLAFVSKSAAEYMQLEKTIAQAATVNSGSKVELEQVRSKLNLIEGYDAVNKTLFNRPIDAFKLLNFDEMAATRSAWAASRASEVASGLRGPATEAPPERILEPGAPHRGPPPTTSTLAETAPEATLSKGLSPSGKLLLKGAGTAGIALMAYDLAHTGHKYIELRAQGNDTGAESAATHFVGRNTGGIIGAMAGGFLTGAGYGLVAGSETDSGTLVTGLAGGVISSI